MGSGRWRPWRELQRRNHIEFEVNPAAELLGGAFYATDGVRAAIVLSPRLGPRDQEEALGHELVHDERRITRPSASAATMELEERIVHREVARRLVPLDELEVFVAAIVRVEGWLDLRLVAEEFGVTSDVATEACRQLDDRWRQLLDRELLRSRRRPTAS